MPSKTKPSVTSRPDLLSSGVIAVFASNSFICSRADRKSPVKAQELPIKQLLMNALSADSKPIAWPSTASLLLLFGSTAPSNTKRPTLSGNNSANKVPR